MPLGHRGYEVLSKGVPSNMDTSGQAECSVKGGGLQGGGKGCRPTHQRTPLPQKAPCKALFDGCHCPNQPHFAQEKVPQTSIGLSISLDSLDTTDSCRDRFGLGCVLAPAAIQEVTIADL